MKTESSLKARLLNYARSTAPGSKAETVRGLLDAHVRPIVSRGLSALDRTDLAYRSVNEIYNRHHSWRKAEAERKSSPEAKRARADKKFRAKYLARLRREEHRLLNPVVSTLREITAAHDSARDRLYKLRALLALRGIAMGRDCSRPDLKVKDMIPAHGGTRLLVSIELARKSGASIDMRGKDATLSETRMSSYGRHSAGETHWKNGKPVSYDRATHDNYIRSFGLITSPTTLAVAMHTHEYTITLPDGYIWERDENGLKAVIYNSRKDDYHPTADDLWVCRKTGDGSTIAAQLQANRDKRIKWETEEAAALADMEGVYVCLRDSLRAGNCHSGSVEFARRHQIDPTRHYRASQVYQMVRSDDNPARIKITIAAAKARHQRECSQGFSLLADHKA